MIEPRFSALPEESNPVPSGDRREGNRFRTICRIAKVHRDGDVGLWLVRNLSDRGMMLTADVPIAVGERLEIALSDNVVLGAKVVWADKGRCGVELDEEVDGAGMLKQLAAEQRAIGYRAPRLPVHSRARIVTEEGMSVEIELVDMSQSGAGVLHRGDLDVGQELQLVLACGLRRGAIVRWSRGKRGGLWFRAPLERHDLESIRRFEG